MAETSEGDSEEVITLGKVAFESLDVFSTKLHIWGGGENPFQEVTASPSLTKRLGNVTKGRTNC